MPQFDSGAAEPIGRFSEGLLLRLLHAFFELDFVGFGLAINSRNTPTLGSAKSAKSIPLDTIISANMLTSTSAKSAKRGLWHFWHLVR